MLIKEPNIIMGKIRIGGDGKFTLVEPYTPEEKDALDKFNRMLVAGDAWERGEIDKMPSWDEV